MSQPQTFKLHLVGTSGESKPRTQLDADAAASDAVKLDLRTTVKSPDSNKKVSLTLPCTVRFTLPSDSSLVPSLLSRQQKLQSTTTERPVDVGVVTSDVKQRSKLNQESKLAAGGGGDVRAIPTTTTRQPAPIRQKSPEKLSVRMNNKTPLGSLNKMPDDSSSRLFASSYSRFESPSKSYIHVEQAYLQYGFVLGNVDRDQYLDVRLETMEIGVSLLACARINLKPLAYGIGALDGWYALLDKSDPIGRPETSVAPVAGHVKAMVSRPTETLLRSCLLCGDGNESNVERFTPTANERIRTEIPEITKQMHQEMSSQMPQQQQVNARPVQCQVQMSRQVQEPDRPQTITQPINNHLSREVAPPPPPSSIVTGRLRDSVDDGHDGAVAAVLHRLRNAIGNAEKKYSDLLDENGNQQQHGPTVKSTHVRASSPPSQPLAFSSRPRNNNNVNDDVSHISDAETESEATSSWIGEVTKEVESFVFDKDEAVQTALDTDTDRVGVQNISIGVQSDQESARRPADVSIESSQTRHSQSILLSMDDEHEASLRKLMAMRTRMIHMLKKT